MLAMWVYPLTLHTFLLNSEDKKRHFMALISVSDQTPIKVLKLFSGKWLQILVEAIEHAFFNGCDSISKEALIGLGWRGCKNSYI